MVLPSQSPDLNLILMLWLEHQGPTPKTNVHILKRHGKEEQVDLVEQISEFSLGLVFLCA